MTVFEKFCENLLSANNKTWKNIFFADELNINVLEYESNKKLQHPLSSMFQYNLMPTINKPTRVRRIAATVADHVVTNNVMSVIQRRSGIIKADTLDHVPIAFPLNTF